MTTLAFTISGGRITEVRRVSSSHVQLRGIVREGDTITVRAHATAPSSNTFLFAGEEESIKVIDAVVAAIVEPDKMQQAYRPGARSGEVSASREASLAREASLGTVSAEARSFIRHEKKEWSNATLFGITMSAWFEVFPAEDPARVNANKNAAGARSQRMIHLSCPVTVMATVRFKMNTLSLKDLLSAASAVRW